MEKPRREATLADLVEYAEVLRDQGYVGIYIWGDGPGVIRWSRREPPGFGRYCILGNKGRIWNIVHGNNEEG
jgi:hypothetical protein